MTLYVSESLLFACLGNWVEQLDADIHNSLKVFS